VDEDGFETIDCGGSDCDDRDPGLYPGSPTFTVEEIARFPGNPDSADGPESRDVATAVDANGDVVIVFEGQSGLWFGRRANGTWDLTTITPMAYPAIGDPSIAVSGGEVVLGFRQEGSAGAVMARNGGGSFVVSNLWNSSAPPVFTTAPDGSLWVAGTDDTGAFGIGAEMNGAFTLTEVQDAFGPPGTRFRIDAAGHHHILWGSGATSRIPPVKYSYATDASGAWVIEEFDEQCFHEKAALAVDGTDVHISYVRPRDLRGVYYKGPSDDVPDAVIQDARGSFSDAPQDRGVAVTVFQGAPRIAFTTTDAIYLASRLGERFSSTPVEDDAGDARAFGSPAFAVAPDGLHLFYFGAASDSSGQLSLRHAFLANDASVGCVTR
jgi:hypothetical protein